MAEKTDQELDEEVIQKLGPGSFGQADVVNRRWRKLRKAAENPVQMMGWKY